MTAKQSACALLAIMLVSIQPVLADEQAEKQILTLNKQISTLYVQKKFADAVPLMKRVVQILGAQGISRKAEYLAARQNYALLLEKLGRTAEAKEVAVPGNSAMVSIPRPPAMGSERERDDDSLSTHAKVCEVTRKLVEKYLIAKGASAVHLSQLDTAFDIRQKSPGMFAVRSDIEYLSSSASKQQGPFEALVKEIDEETWALPYFQMIPIRHEVKALTYKIDKVCAASAADKAIIADPTVNITRVVVDQVLRSDGKGHSWWEPVYGEKRTVTSRADNLSFVTDAKAICDAHHITEPETIMKAIREGGVFVQLEGGCCLLIESPKDGSKWRAGIAVTLSSDPKESSYVRVSNSDVGEEASAQVVAH